MAEYVRDPGGKRRRINVSIAPDTVRALENVMGREDVNLTDALRRLVAYGDFVYRAVRENGEEVLVSDGERVREVVLF